MIDETLRILGGGICLGCCGWFDYFLLLKKLNVRMVEMRAYLLVYLCAFWAFLPYNAIVCYQRLCYQAVFVLQISLICIVVFMVLKIAWHKERASIRSGLATGEEHSQYADFLFPDRGYLYTTTVSYSTGEGVKIDFCNATERLVCYRTQKSVFIHLSFEPNRVCPLTQRELLGCCPRPTTHESVHGRNSWSEVVLDGPKWQTGADVGVPCCKHRCPLITGSIVSERNNFVFMLDSPIGVDAPWPPCGLDC